MNPPGKTMKPKLRLSLITAVIPLFIADGLTAAGVALYDNIDVEPLVQSSGFIGLQFDDRNERLAQQFKTRESDTISSVSLFLQGKGSPTGHVAVEIWDGAVDGTPGDFVATFGTFDVAALTSGDPRAEPSNHIVTLNNLLTGLSAHSDYYVVLNNLGTDINGSNTYRFGQRGRVDDAQDEGTHGADQMMASAPPSLSWTNVNDLLGGCHPTGACSNFLRMSVMAGLRGDFSRSGTLDTLDIDMLSAEINAGTHLSMFDLTGDSVVDTKDLTTWLSDAAEYNGFSDYLLGDSNLDGSVDATDLNNLALHWQQNGTQWSAGNFTADGSINALDLNALALNWQQTIPMASTVSAPVPEPSASILALVGISLAWGRARRS